MYSLIKKLLFQLDTERSHHLALQSLLWFYRLHLSSVFFPAVPSQPVTVMGLAFPNRVGLAAGLDKNADYVDALAALGFGFIEIGTITPQPQIGNPKPRLFRLIEQEAIINRMGFNNKGVAHVVHNLERMRYRGILGINIGKNRDTPIENAVADYVFCFRHLWKFATYITINISSPNTPGLRDLQQTAHLHALLSTLKQEQQTIFQTQQKYVPLVVKISPDLTEVEVKEVAAALLQYQIDGVIATNTTTARTGVENSPFGSELGGLSGRPLQTQSSKIIKQLSILLQEKIPIIASGGITDLVSAQEKYAAGATLIQLYTGFIYHGPALIKQLSKADTI